MAKIEDRAVYLKANSLNKTLHQAILDGDIGPSGGGGGGGGSTELFNHTVQVNGSSYSSLTGLNYFRAPASGSISSVKLQIWTMNGIVAGEMAIDIKKNTTPDDVGMTSILSAPASIDFATAADYDIATGALASASFSSGDFIRLDVTSIPIGFVGTISISVYA
jgi:hypothetical protein